MEKDEVHPDDFKFERRIDFARGLLDSIREIYYGRVVSAEEEGAIDAQSEIQQLNSQLEDAMAEVEGLKSQLDEVRGDVVGYVSEIETLASQNSDLRSAMESTLGGIEHQYGWAQRTLSFTVNINDRIIQVHRPPLMLLPLGFDIGKVKGQFFQNLLDKESRVNYVRAQRNVYDPAFLSDEGALESFRMVGSLKSDKSDFKIFGLEARVSGVEAHDVPYLNINAVPIKDTDKFMNVKVENPLTVHSLENVTYVVRGK